MLLIAPVQQELLKDKPKGYDDTELRKNYHHRSDVPAITHIDYRKN